jgi:hypothetical protein
MTKDEALKLVRDWIAERPADRPVSAGKMISIIDRALAQPEDYIASIIACRDALDAQPVPRRWVGLTDEEVYPLANEHLHYQMEGYEVSGVYNLARAIEAKLKEKNT